MSKTPCAEVLAQLINCREGCYGLLQVPWFQVGTPFLVSTEISASVADDIVEYQQDRRTRASQSVPGHSDEPEPSRPKTFLRRYCAPRTFLPA